MARETKVGLLVGMGVILLIGIILSDHLAVVQHQEPAKLVGFGNQAQQSIAPLPEPEVAMGLTPEAGNAQNPQPPMAGRATPVFTPQELVNPPAPQPNVVPGTTPGNNTPINTGPVATAETHTPAEAPKPQPMAIHVVKHGDTLYQLARQYYKDAEKWSLIQEANAGSIGSQGQLRDGVKLVIPKKPEPVAPSELLNSQMFTTADPANSNGAANGTRVRVIEVQAGETLATIAKEQLGSSGRWKEILDVNKDQIKKPQDLQIGMKLKMPAAPSTPTPTAAPALAPTTTPTASAPAPAPSTTAVKSIPATPRTYTVQAGDSLASIAAKVLGNKTRWDVIYQANRKHLASPADLKIGQVLIIPAASSR